MVSPVHGDYRRCQAEIPLIVLCRFPGPALLSRTVNKYAHYISGRTIDVGAGPHRRYAFPKATEYIRMDLEGVPNLDLIGSAEDIPAPNESFDSVVCTQTLIDFFDPPAAFTEMARVLKPGGYLLLTTPFILARSDDKNQYWHPTDYALRRLAIEAGLEPILIEGCGGYHSAIFQLRTRYLIRRYKLMDQWYSRAVSFVFKLFGSIAIWRDARLPQHIKEFATDNWIMVAQKQLKPQPR
jgi:SAM-dependent methyltransferase